MSTEEEKLLKEAKKLSWEDRLTHKNWKVRNEANADVAAVLCSVTDPKDPRIREFGPFFKKSIGDSNAPVQEKALDALIAYLKAADADAERYAKDVCDVIVAKCLKGRPKTVEKAQMVFMLWIELEAVDAFLDAMEKAIKNKVAKAVVPAIDVMFQALSEFGAKVVPPKRILKMLPELFDHQDQNVRASAKGLTLELCRWIGKESVKSILFEKMRDTMKKELEAELANVNGTARPSRKIRFFFSFLLFFIFIFLLRFWSLICTSSPRSEQDKEQEVLSELVGPGPSEDAVPDAFQEIDEYELVDPVDILTPLEKTVFWNGVKAAKWSERKQAVAELTKLTSTKRIAPGDFTEICRTLKKLILDVNIAVAIEAIQAVGNLAKGLRTHFSGNSRVLIPILLEKLKEKKPMLTEALTQSLQAMHKAGCVNLTDILEAVKTAVKNKVPLVRSLTLNWVTFCTETSTKAAIQKVQKEYIVICMESLNDGTPEVRDAAFAALAALVKIAGMRPSDKLLTKLDDVRRKKLSELIGGSEAVAFGTCSVAVQASGGTVVSSVDASDGSFVRRSAASMLSDKKPSQAVPASEKGGASKSSVNKKRNAAGQEKAPKPSAVKSLKEIGHKLGSAQADRFKQLKSTAPRKRLEETLEASKVKSSRPTPKTNCSNAGNLSSTRRHGALRSSQNIELLSQPLLNVLQFCASRTSCLLKVLEFLPELFDLLRTEGYQMTDSDAAIIVPMLVEKSGHRILEVREKIWELIKIIIHTYSATKTFPYIMEGLHSKNSQTRIECLDMVGFIIANHGAEVAGQLKYLQVVAKLTAERDCETQKAAFNTLAFGYKILGDDIWRCVGKLTDAQRSTLEDKFRQNNAAQKMDKREEKFREAKGVLMRSVRKSGVDAAEPSGEISSSIRGPILYKENLGHLELNVERHSIPQKYASTISPVDWKGVLDFIECGTPEQVRVMLQSLLLMQMEKNAVAQRKPSSLPSSTPCQTLPSPAYKKSLDVEKSTNNKVEHTYFSLQSSNSEDQRAISDMGNSRKCIVPPGDTNGTLDMIKERLISMQLEADAGYPEHSLRASTHVNGSLSQG